MSTIYQKIANLTPEQRAAFEEKLKAKGLKNPVVEHHQIPARQITEDIPLSFAQQRLWFIQQFDPENTAYNMMGVLNIQGQLNIEALKASIIAVAQRHEPLRTIFDVNASQQAVQIILEKPQIDFKFYSKSELEHQNLEQLIKDVAFTPYDLSKPQLRASIIETGQHEYVLALGTHHITSDRWSFTIFVKEMSFYYSAINKNQTAILPDNPIQYADFAIWQREQLQGEKLQKQLDYWSEKLAEPRENIQLPTDFPRTETPSYSGAQLAVNINKSTSEALRQLASQQEVSLYTLLLAVFKLLVHRYTGLNDIIVGTEVANRDHSELQNLMGPLVNTLVLRTKVQHNTSFVSFLKEVNQTFKDAVSHQDLPFEKIVEHINPERSLQQMSPLFQLKFDVQHSDLKPFELDDIHITRYPLADESTKFELRFNLQDIGDSIGGQIEYARDLYKQETIERILGHYINLLEQISRNSSSKLGDLNLLSHSEQQQLSTWNSTASNYPKKTITERLLPALNESPASIAIIDGNKQWSYGELDLLTSQLAYFLQEKDIKPRDRVGICLESPCASVISILAIIKCGASYVPIDRNNPTDRLLQIVEDAQLKVLLTDSSVKKEIGESLTSFTEQLIYSDVLSNINSASPKNYQQIDQKINDILYLIYTSGTTGKPKAATVSHANANNLQYWYINNYAFNNHDKHLIFSAIAFDLTQKNIFAPLLTGGTIIFSESVDYSPTAIIKAIKKHKATTINCAPSAFYPILEQLESNGDLNFTALQSVKKVMFGGEPIQLPLLDSWLKQGYSDVYNMYGPTECTDIACATIVKPENSNNIGKAINNVSLHVLDEQYQQALPVGIAGELYIGGAGVGGGYWQQDKLSQQRFSKTEKYGTLYQTGDLVKRLEDGSLEYLGRIDGQIKLRGYRIETAEIEQQLVALDGVKQAAVSLVDINDDQQQVLLVAYIVTDDAWLQTKQQWREQLKLQLPSYMIPAAIVELSALPLSNNGKVDRKSLPKPDSHLLVNKHETTFVAPETATEQTLVELWQAILPENTSQHLGTQHNFFDIGGHSLLAIKIIASIQEQFAINIGLRDFFKEPTISALAKIIDNNQSSGTALPMPKLECDNENRFDEFPLTDIQYAYWMGRNRAFELGNIGTQGYREFIIKNLSVETITTALNQLILRHPMLRAIVNKNGSQQVLETVEDYKIEYHDLSAEKNQQQYIESIRERLVNQSFDTSLWPLFSIEAAQIEKDSLRLFMSFDVIIADAWSFQIIGREMALLTTGHSLPALDMQFRDYVIAENNFIDSEHYEQAKHYWLNRIDDLPAAADLPLIKQAKQIEQPVFKRRNYELNAEQWSTLKGLAQKANITPSALLLTAFSDILSAWSRNKQFTLNLTLFNRYPVHPQIDNIVGDFTASLLLAVNSLSAVSFAERANLLQEQLWQDLDHRAMSGVKVLRELAKRQQRNTTALMPIVFTSTLGQNQSASPQDLGLDVERAYSISQTSQVYFDHQVGEANGKLLFNWDTIDEMFPEQLLDQMFESYCNYLIKLCDASQWHQPQYIDLQQHLVHYQQLNATAQSTANSENTLLHQLFFEQALRTPNLAAVICDQRELSYAQLQQASYYYANELVEKLAELEISEPQLIAVCIPKGWQQIVACLAILAAGHSYVPVDSRLPCARREALFKDIQCPVVVTDSHLSEETQTLISDNTQLLIIENAIEQLLSQAETTEQLEQQLLSVAQQINDKQLAYVIFTSGSTGKPKGVMIDHRGAVNTIHDINQRYAVNEKDRVFALSALNFDLSVYDIFGPLAVGAALVIPTAEQLNNPAQWHHLVEKHQVSIWNTVPALAQLIENEYNSKQQQNSQLRVIMMSGDWIPLSLPSHLMQCFPNASINSLGGATEASIWSIHYPITQVENHWQSIPYGMPLNNQSWYVLNEDLQPCPPWVVGKLYIGGTGVAKGYWDRPELSAERFIPNPFNQGNENDLYLYDTGDLGRLCPSVDQQGTMALEFMGREDFQVKINGYRIELGEIEAILNQHPAIEQCLLSTFGKTPQLVAYIVLDKTHNINGDDNSTINQQLQAHLKLSLPNYMVPDNFVHMDAFPLSSNGKIDRKSLPTPAIHTEKRKLIAAANPQEEQILNAWQAVLAVDSISMDDNFFALGGDSLKAMQLLTQLQQIFSVEMNIAMIFTALTPAEQSEQIKQLSLAENCQQDELVAITSADQMINIDELDETDLDSMLANLLADDEKNQE